MEFKVERKNNMGLILVIKTWRKKVLQGTVMQIKKALINDGLRISKVSEYFPFQLFIILQ